MVTPLAFHTTMPSRGVKSWPAVADGHGCAAERAASTAPWMVR